MVDRDRLAEALKGEVADLLQRDDLFNGGGDPPADQDLAALRLGTEPPSIS